MKALVKAASAAGLSLVDVDTPPIARDDVLIRILKTAICGTDVHIWEWDDWARRTVPVPMVVGHEYVGVIAAVGDGVLGLEKGQLVSGEGHVVCGRCRNCRAGLRHLCANTVSVGSTRPGAFAEYLALPASNVWPLDDAIPLEVASLFDALGNATHTALAFNLIGEDVLITGAGPIGCMAAAIARHVGARHVVVTDVNPYRLDLARASGASLALDVRSAGLDEAMTRLEMREGFDVGLEMSGNPAALRDMIANMSHGARIAMLGIPSGEMSMDWHTVIFNMLTIKGIYGREMYETWYKMTVMLESGLDITPVITHRFPSTEFENGFEAMLSGNSGKVVLTWS